jgi:transcriptional regulator with XRE-family HTH domain
MQQLDLIAIGNRLKSIRLKHAVTQKELSEAANIHTITISRAENGTKKPTSEHLDYFAKNYNYSRDWILTGQGKDQVKKTKFEEQKDLHLKVIEMETELKEIRQMMAQILALLDKG